MDTLTDPRTALWERRKVTTEKLATLTLYRATLCGCDRCHDSDRIEEMGALSARATEAINELGNQICERKPTCAP